MRESRIIGFTDLVSLRGPPHDGPEKGHFLIIFHHRFNCGISTFKIQNLYLTFGALKIKVVQGWRPKIKELKVWRPKD